MKKFLLLMVMPILLLMIVILTLQYPDYLKTILDIPRNIWSWILYFGFKVDLAIFVATFSLILSGFNLVLYRSEIRLLKKQYEASQAVKAKKVMEIVIHEVKKCEDIPDRPLKWLGVWLIVNNRSNEQPLFRSLSVELRFNRLRSSMTWFERLHEKISPTIHRLGFVMYTDGITCQNLYIPHINSDIEKNFFMMDWDTKEKVYFNSENPYRLDEINQKKLWYLFGLIPYEVGTDLMNNGYYLREVKLVFNTDMTEISTTRKFFRRQWISKDALGNYTKHKFNFKCAMPPLIIVDPTDK